MTAEAVQPAIGRGAWWARAARRWIVRLGAVGCAGALASWLGFRAAVAWWPYPIGIDQAPADSSRVEDRNGVELAAFVAGDGQWRISLSDDQMSPHLVGAIVAVEDSRFFEHHGVDWRSVGAAAWHDVTHLSGRRGASTLTMQLERLRDPQPHTLVSKIEQAVRAEQIESKLGKRQILIEYLNRAPFGGNLVGAGAASWRYFGRPCRELSLAEAALLAGLPQSPSRLRPDRFPKRARERRDHVLDRMLACGFITARQHDDAIAEPVNAVWRPLPQDRSADDLPPADGALPALVNQVRNREGGTIRSTLDATVQRQAAMAARQRLASVAASGISSIAVVVLDGNTGECLADVSLGAGNRGLDLTARRRSTGSALKPFIYAAAFDAGIYGPQSILSDSPAAWPGYAPNDFDRSFRGKLTASAALAESRNIPAMVVLSKVGVESAIGVMDAAGLHGLARKPGRYGLSLAIGGAEASPMELAQAYAMLGRGGSPSHCLRPVSCWEVLGTISETSRTVGVWPQAVKSHVAWKTGTSSGRRDAWCAAVTRRRTVVVWMGNARGQSSVALVGQEAAAPLALQLIAMFDPVDEAWPRVAEKPVDLASARSADDNGLVIVRPAKGEQFVITSDVPRERQRVRLEAVQRGSQSATWWFVDGKPLAGSGAAQLWWDATPGTHEIRVVNDVGRSAMVRVGVQIAGR
jgi:penicillin-binding protein 1C